jgi:hypothetical protein
MTNFSDGSVPEDKPEADVAEQQVPADAVDAPALDIDYIEDRSEAEANPADIIDQAIDIPFSEDDRPAE